MKPKPIYVETRIRAPLEAVWHATQDPQEHEKWDLRFTAIRYLPKTSPNHPQRFLYETRIGFGLRVRGEGESTGEKASEYERTSALRFWSDSPISLIREGSGYWRYIALPDGTTRFLTWYDYETRFGVAGRLLDAAIFRPLMGRATAWGFDCLRLSLESGLEPREARLRFWADLFARLGLGLAWFYQGLIPKLLFPESGERAILLSAGFSLSTANALLIAIGLAQIIIGVLFLVLPYSRWLYGVTLILLPMLGIGALLHVPELFVQPFNPASLSIAMAALAATGLAASRTPIHPNASRCRRTPPARKPPR